MRCNGPVKMYPTRQAHSQRRLLQWREASARKRAGIRIRRNAAEVAALRADVVAAKAAGEPTSVVAARLGIPVTYVQKLARAA